MKPKKKLGYAHKKRGTVIHSSDLVWSGTQWADLIFTGLDAKVGTTYKRDMPFMLTRKRIRKLWLPFLHFKLVLPLLSIRTNVLRQSYETGAFSYIALGVTIWKWKFEFELYEPLSWRR